jgi:predicted DNA-binding protein (MmcQ/YjbR family)
MNNKTIKKYLSSKPEALEDYPFGEDVVVFKVKNKMFALLARQEGTLRVNLKCDPEQAFILRDIFTAVIPGYHMNKKHWNTVILDGSIAHGEIERMIDHSYSLVVKGLPKKVRQTLELVHGPDNIYCGQ